RALRLAIEDVSTRRFSRGPTPAAAGLTARFRAMNVGRDIAGRAFGAINFAVIVSAALDRAIAAIGTGHVQDRIMGTRNRAFGASAAAGAASAIGGLAVDIAGRRDAFDVAIVAAGSALVIARGLVAGH